MPKVKKKLHKHSGTVALLGFASMIVAISFFNLAIFLSPQQKRVVRVYERVEEPHNQTMIGYWNGFLEKNPDYLPGWLELAKLRVDNNEISDAFLAANEALKIDPNSDLVKDTLQQIDLKQ